MRRTLQCYYGRCDNSTGKQDEDAETAAFCGANFSSGTAVLPIRRYVNYTRSDCILCCSCSFVVARRFFFGCLLSLLFLLFLFLLLLLPSLLWFVRAGGFFAIVASWSPTARRWIDFWVYDLHDIRGLVLRVELDVGAIHVHLSRWMICWVNVRCWRQECSRLHKPIIRRRHKPLCSWGSKPVSCRRRRRHHILLRHSGLDELVRHPTHLNNLGYWSWPSRRHHHVWIVHVAVAHVIIRHVRWTWNSCLI